MTASSRTKLGRRLVVGLPFAWLALFFLTPFAIVLRISLSETALAQPPYRPLLPQSADLTAWRAVFEALGPGNFATLAADDLYWRAALSSAWIAALATTLLILVGFPIALAMARAPRRWRPVLLALVVLPFWTSLLIRAYSLVAILRPAGHLDAALGAMGLPAGSVALLNTDAAVLLGAVYAYLPFMILPLYASLRQDGTLLDAASDLGASPLAAFLTVTLPLALPGLAAGSLLCFIPIAGEFLIPDLLGGADTLMLGRVLWSEFFANRDWPLASAVAVVMTLGLLGPILLFRHLELRRLEART